MDLDLQRAARRPVAPDPEAELIRLVQLARVDALDLRDRRLLVMLGVFEGEPERAWLRGVLNSAFRTEAALGGLRETDLKGPVLAACVAVVRRTLRSWLREPQLHQELSARLAEFASLSARPLLPSRQDRGRDLGRELTAFLELNRPEGRREAGVLALRELFGALSRSGRGHLHRAMAHAEPFVSAQGIREAFSVEFVRHALGRALA